MSTKVRTDVTEYLRTSFDGSDCDYLDGEVARRNFNDIKRERGQTYFPNNARAPEVTEECVCLRHAHSHP